MVISFNQQLFYTLRHALINVSGTQLNIHLQATTLLYIDIQFLIQFELAIRFFLKKRGYISA